MMMMRAMLALAVAALCATARPASAAAGAPHRVAPADSSDYNAAKDQVRERGWSCVAVKAQRAEHAFAYSVGLSGKHLPELGIFGTDDPAGACAAVDRVARALITAGRAPRNGTEVFRNADGRVVLRAVIRKEFFDRCILAKRWRDEHRIADARAMQILVLDPGEAMPR